MHAQHGIVAIAAAIVGAGSTVAAGPANGGAPADTVHAVVRGQVFTADGWPPAGLRVFLRHAAGTDSVDVDDAGAFTLVGSPIEQDTVEVFIDDAGRERKWYYPTYVRLRRHELDRDLRFILVPRAWVIEAGAFAGVAVEINLAAAFRPVIGDPTSSFYRRAIVAPDTPRVYRTRSWPAEAFPIPVVFRRNSREPPITRRDSIAFWKTVWSMEEAFGERLFTPGRIEDHVGRDGRPLGAIIVGLRRDLESAGRAGARGTTRENSGGVVSFRGGVVSLRERSGLGYLRLVAHELLHALGFGHTCEWLSVMSAGCAHTRAERPAPHDVGHVQVLRRVYELQRRHDARFGLLEALNGERVLVLGLSPDDATAMRQSTAAR